MGLRRVPSNMKLRESDLQAMSGLLDCKAIKAKIHTKLFSIGIQLIKRHGPLN
jgi:hypothetical protein